jgi:NAD(P)-dependent dehydrogenase (short-subunit alcohol dehydrogenase family)
MLPRVSEAGLRGRRVFITGAARGIGAASARRLKASGARVAVAGIEPELLSELASELGGAPWFECDVSDREQVEEAVNAAARALGGLDVVMANAGVAAQLPLVGGEPEIFERTIAVNVLGVYYTLRAAGPHIGHPNGYALAVSSLAAAVHPPLMGAYCASKAAVEALANSLRSELRHTGARLGVAYFAEIDTDMTQRGFGTQAAKRLAGRGGAITGVAPLEKAIDAVERGIARRSRRVAAPGWVGPILPVRDLVQRLVELRFRRGVEKTLEVALEEHAPLTTSQPR